MARLAARQGGVVSQQQLLALAVSYAAVHRRVQAGRLHPMHRGVFAVGHPLAGVEGRRWAALLPCGGSAVISHGSAADAYGFRPSDSGLIHVSVRGRAGRERRTGIRIHRPRALPDDEITRIRGLPVTTPPRTLLDLAATGLRGRALETALDRAERLRLLDFADLRRLLARYPRRPGTRLLERSWSDTAVPWTE